MHKYPSDISVSETCIDLNFVNGRKDGTKTTSSVSRRRNGAHGKYPKLFLNIINVTIRWHNLLPMQLQIQRFDGKYTRRQRSGTDTIKYRT